MTPSWKIVERLAALDPTRRVRRDGMYVDECFFCNEQITHSTTCLWSQAREALAAYWELEKHT